jgi:hypothetical protein
MAFSVNYQAATAPPWQDTGMQNLIRDADVLGAAPYIPYRESRLAQFSPDTLEAQRLARAGLGEYLPYLQRAESYLPRAGAPAYENIRRYMNPYEQEVIDRAGQDATKTFREGILPQLEQQFVSRGQLGSKRHRELALQAAADLQNNLAGQRASMRSKHYQEAANMQHADQIRAMETARQLASLANQRQAGRAVDTSILSGIGGDTEARRQQELNMRYEAFMRQLEYPWDMVQRRANILHGMPMQTMTSTLNMEPLQRQTNTAGLLGSMALQALGARMAMGNRGGNPLGLKRGGAIPMRAR